MLAGLVDRVTYYNADSGFCGLRVTARGQRDPITVIGHAATVAAGELVQASRVWSNDRQRRAPIPYGDKERRRAIRCGRTAHNGQKEGAGVMLRAPR